jgi:hypothetical protein
MAKNPRPAKPPKPPKPTRAERKAARAAAKVKRREQYRAMRQAFGMTRKNDKRLIPYLILAFVIGFSVVYLPFLLITGWKFISIIPALFTGLIAAMAVFSRRAQRSAYDQAEGQPGAAIYVLQNMRGDWRLTEAVAATGQFDAVHRVVGRPGIVLIAEGSPQRVKGLLAQEKKRIARIAGDTPIYDFIVGADADVALRSLSVKLMRLPRNLTKDQVAVLDRRLAALSAMRNPLPQGPLPGGGKMRGAQRTVRRRTS